jgi:DNA-binding response OmpR family regulator
MVRFVANRSQEKHMNAIHEKPASQPALESRTRAVVLSRDPANPEWERDLAGQGIEIRAARDWDQLVEYFTPGAGEVIIVVQQGMGVDTFSLCRSLRELDPVAPLLLLCREMTELEEVLGLELGADDVLPLDVPARVLAARVRSLLRRTRNGVRQIARAETLAFGQLEIRKAERAVYFRGKLVALSTGEFDLLLLLASRAGEVVPHGEILKQLRGLHLSAEDRSIDARLYRLRRRFGNTEDIKHRLRSVRPNGYMFSDMAWS